MNDDYTYVSNAIEGVGALSLLGAEVTKIVPESSEVTFLCDDDEKCKTVRGVLGRYCKINGVIVSSDEVSECKKIRVNDGCGLIVGAGGARCVSVAKFVATQFGLPLIFVALDQSCHDYLTGASTLTCDGYPEIYKVSVPDRVIADSTLLGDGDENAKGYGAICARMVTLFDEDVRRAMGEEVDDAIYGRLLSEIKGVIERQKSLTARMIMQSALKISFYLEKMHAYTDGCRQSALVLSMIKKRQNLEVKTQVENEIVLSPLVMSCYLLGICSSAVNGVCVPNNNAQIDCMYKFLGISPLLAVKVVGKYETLESIQRKAHCLSVYRKELIFRGETYRRVLEFVQNQVKRLYKDRGFSYNKYLDGQTVKRCFALAPEMRGKSVLFSLMKQKGLLFALSK